MRFVNLSSFPLYNGEMKITLDPGRLTRDCRSMREWFDGLRKSTRGYAMLLSDDDLQIISEMLALDRKACEKASSVPDGSVSMKEEALRRISEAMSARKAARSLKTASELEEARRTEAEARSESNRLDEYGVPVRDGSEASGPGSVVVPELHPEMGTDFSSVLANNLAVLHGQGKNVVVAGETKVSHDPAHYRNEARRLPPGMPDLPGAAASASADSREAKWRPGQPV